MKEPKRYCCGSGEGMFEDDKNGNWVEYSEHKAIVDALTKQLRKHDVNGSSIRMPKPCLKFEGLDNLSIVSENPIPLSDLFELHLKLENYLKTRPETIVNNDGLIVCFNNYH